MIRNNLAQHRCSELSPSVPLRKTPTTNRAASRSPPRTALELQNAWEGPQM